MLNNGEIKIVFDLIEPALKQGQPPANVVLAHIDHSAA